MPDDLRRFIRDRPPSPSPTRFRVIRLACILLLSAAGGGVAAQITLQRSTLPSRRVEVLRSIAAIPPHLAAQLEQPTAFQQIASGRYFVFDRRGHTVWEVDKEMQSTWKLVQIGQEAGRIIEPTAFDADPALGSFVVADAPHNVERIQVFGVSGVPLGGFTLPGRAEPRIVLDSLVLNGIGSLQYTGRSILVSQPETGSLMTEYTLRGTPIRSIGRLRATGHEDDRFLHLALNTGLPLVNPLGGFYFVFLAGPPQFRKYDARGGLEFERHVEGRELDAFVAALPTRWPTRTVGGTDLPVVTPTVRTAAVDGHGRLWMSLAVPYTYVYDAEGEKVRTVQFRGAGPVEPTSFAFAPGGHLLVTPGLYEFDAGR